ncbi:hypothetical protein [uncultured Microscilla sp.]|uniref:hypothetical protein n=1 Tax=uncultured Microscilla sp. TaxID=432653 RepID=UPI002618A7E0|nr:hypothetical protein [uncultured Microscilla sp.]
MNLFKNLYHLVKLTLDMRSANRESGALHKKAQKMMQPFIQAAEVYNDGSITPRMHKKMQWYMVETLWMSEQFAQLHQTKLDHATQQASAFSGALLGISDILIDDLPEGSLAHTQNFLYAPDQHTPQTPLEKLYLAYFQAFESCLSADNRVQTKEYYWASLEAQVASRRQFEPDLPSEDLIQILKDKCGYTTLLCRAVLPLPIDASEHTMMYELGALVQFINDINDLHKDSTQGIKNFANQFDTTIAMKKALLEQTTKAFGLFQNIGYKRKSAIYFLFIFHSFVVVSLAQLRYYEHLCQGHYKLERFLKLPPKSTKVQPFLWQNLQFSIPKMLNFDFTHPTTRLN